MSLSVRQSSNNASVQRREANRRRGNRGHRRVRARRIVEGARYKITKRCLERRFFMVPDTSEVQQLIGYCLGLCLERFGLKLHAAIFMSNHYHLDVTDPHGNMPAFKCMLNALIARGLNCLRGRFDKFWSADRACDVELIEDSDVLEGMAYTLANPVSGGLVRRSGRWPGFTTSGQKLGTTRTFKRPDFFFDGDNADVPDEVEVEVVRPEVMKDLDDAAFGERLEAEVAKLEQKAAAKMRKEHRRFLGETRIINQRWTSRPKSYETRFGPRPKVSARSKWARIAALQRDAKWDARYADKYDRLLQGEDVVFPHGTYALKHFAGVRVEAAPP